MLTDIAHRRRKKALENGRKIFCSGYLFAIHKYLFPKLSENLLSEDGFISHKVYKSGKNITYSTKSEVFVRFPSNFEDWINQKRRSIGGYNQMQKMIGTRIRSFSQESLGFTDFFKYISGPKEMAWILTLFIARLYVWALIYRDINIRKRSRANLWKRVESTK